MSQIALPLDPPIDPDGHRFFVTASNDAAVHLLDHWGTWPVRAALLAGPPRSGRTLLARIFAGKSGGRVIDDADGHDEAELFHAWNRAQADRQPLLIVVDGHWSATLPDLRSRLAASPRGTIEAPDDALVRALLADQFHRRGLDARADLIDWLTARVERSHAALEHVVLRLDRDVTERQRRLSIPLARDVLGEAGLLATDAMEQPR